MFHHHTHHEHGAGLRKRGLLDALLGTDQTSDSSNTVNAPQQPDNAPKQQDNAPQQQSVSFVYVTAEPTFTGPIGGYKTMDGSDAGAPAFGVGDPVQQTALRTTTQPATEEQTKEPTKDTKNDPATATSLENPTGPITMDGAMPTTLATVAATGPAVTSVLTPTGLGQALATSSSASAATITAKPSGSEGISAGAKAGIAIGVILGVGLIAGLLLFWLHKKKQSRKLAEEEDNEKSFAAGPPPPPPMTQPVTSSKPPQLNFRPVTEFAPDLSLGGASSGNAFAAAGAAAGASRNLTGHQPDDRSYNGSPQTPNSTASGQNPFKDPVNPFDSHADASVPPTPLAKDAPGFQAVDTPIRDSGILPSASTVGAAAAGAAVGAAALAASQSDKKQPANVDNQEKRSVSPVSGPSPPSPQSAVSAGSASAAPGNVAAFAAVGPAVPTNVHRVQMDFTPSMDDELELRAGQLVRLLHEYDDGWALCVRLDRSQQGVAPRTCLSARPVKPRSRPSGSGPGPRGLPVVGPNGCPMSPACDPMSPAPSAQPARFYPQDGRSMSPGRPAMPGRPEPPRPQQGRPMSPVQFPPAPRSQSPGPGNRPAPQRSMSPGPYGPPGMQKPSTPISQRRRSNSASGVLGNIGRVNEPPRPSPLAKPMSQQPPYPNLPPAREPPQGPIPRKPVPVPGQPL
ncbi:hypothetical protein VTN00DRAFT_9349 [Thermoascus crustaceus]|uniref:uncharacterized protein n=1 Tax=Thermoascus crustaceus TaxID=5088 RepID=UPI0037431626